MYKYVLEDINTELSEKLEEEGFSVVEDSFGGEMTLCIYTTERVDSFLKNNGVNFHCEELKDTDWQNYWKNFLKPSMLVDGVSCYYDDEDRIPSAFSIKLIPAMAFGTGTHPTTRLAAALIKNVVKNGSFLDVGCGSGILSILAIISGAKKVFSFDNDFTAILNAKENMKLNGISYEEIWCGDSHSIGGNLVFDVVCANIVSSVLLEINQTLLEHAGSYIILSGIMENELDFFINNFDFGDYEIDKLVHEANWAGMRLVK